jgi:hypothetical protein
MDKGWLYKREFEKIVQDGFWPDRDVLSKDNKRYWAMAHVLRSIPEDDYEKLKEQFKHEWFVPSEKENGRTFFYVAQSQSRLLPALVRIIYLSPLLEKVPSESATAVTSHELAKIFLDHKFEPKPEYQRLQEEDQAWELVRKWGFEKEANEHRKRAEELK